MSHRISIQQAKDKYNWDQHCQELNKNNIKVNTIPRWRKKQKQRTSKLNSFISMLQRRGGHVEQKEKKKK